MSSFYSELEKMATECEELFGDINDNCATYEQMEAFSIHGDFLDYIPVEVQARVAKTIMYWVYTYNSDCDFHDFFYTPLNAERENTIQTIENACLPSKSEEKLLKKVKLGEDKSKKRRYDITKATAFRATLRNFTETYGHVDKQGLKSLKKMGIENKPYFKMVDLIDKYIQDLETKSFKMAHELTYYNTPKIKTNKKVLTKYLKRLKKLYYLPFNDKNITTLMANITPPQFDLD